MLTLAGLLIIVAAVFIITGLLALTVNAIRRKRTSKWAFITGSGCGIFIIGVILAYVADLDENQPNDISAPVTGTISQGITTELVSQTIPVSGGTISYHKPGDPLDGLNETGR